MRKNLTENHAQFGHRPSRWCANHALGQKSLKQNIRYKRRQIINLLRMPTCLRLDMLLQCETDITLPEIGEEIPQKHL
jgi:hypothetical protein